MVHELTSKLDNIKNIWPCDGEVQEVANESYIGARGYLEVFCNLKLYSRGNLRGLQLNMLESKSISKVYFL